MIARLPLPGQCVGADGDSEILAYPEQKPVDITKTYYEKMLREVLGLERSDKLISELSIKGEIKKLPDELVKPLVLADVKMHWDGPEQSWLSDGPIGIASILKKPVYKLCEGQGAPGAQAQWRHHDHVPRPWTIRPTTSSSTRATPLRLQQRC
jgi:hypothetical protein